MPDHISTALGDAYEFTDCTKQCLEACGKDLSFDQALDLVDQLPRALRDHKDSESLKVQAIKVISDRLREWEEAKRDGGDDDGSEDEDDSGDEVDEEERLKLKGSAGDALAKYLGPMQDCYSPGDATTDGVEGFHKLVSLKAHVKVGVCILCFTVYRLSSKRLRLPYG